MKTRGICGSAFAIAVAALLVGCGSSVPGTAGVETVRPLGAGLSWRGPAADIVSAFAEPASTSANCLTNTAEVSTSDQAMRVILFLPNTECVAQYGNQVGMNGRHGMFDSVPVNDGLFAPINDGAGQFTAFNRPYVEYTNRENQYTDTIGVLSLRKPTADGQRTVMLLITSHQSDPVPTETAFLQQVAAGIIA